MSLPTLARLRCRLGGRRFGPVFIDDRLFDLPYCTGGSPFGKSLADGTGELPVALREYFALSFGLPANLRETRQGGAVSGGVASPDSHGGIVVQANKELMNHP